MHIVQFKNKLKIHTFIFVEFKNSNPFKNSIIYKVVKEIYFHRKNFIFIDIILFS